MALALIVFLITSFPLHLALNRKLGIRNSSWIYRLSVHNIVSTFSLVALLSLLRLLDYMFYREVMYIFYGPFVIEWSAFGENFAFMNVVYSCIQYVIREASLLGIILTFGVSMMHVIKRFFEKSKTCLISYLAIGIVAIVLCVSTSFIPTNDADFFTYIDKCIMNFGNGIIFGLKIALVILTEKLIINILKNHIEIIEEGRVLLKR